METLSVVNFAMLSVVLIYIAGRLSAGYLCTDLVT